MKRIPAPTLLRRRSLAAVLAPLLLLGAASAQAPEPQPSTREDLRALLMPIREAHGLPALGAAIVKDGRVTGLGVVGVRALGRPEEATEADLWHLGSCGKAMSATVIARLVEQGHLRWEATLGEVLGARVPAMQADWKPVTLVQLLAHRGGLPKDFASEDWARLQERRGSTTEQRLLLAELVLGRAPAAAPGSRHEYSNAGYGLAGLMAEVATGKAWEDLVQSELFEPLGMRDAGFGPPKTSPGQLDQPLGHREGNAVAPSPWADNPPAIAPAGTMHASLESWGRFAAVHMGAQPAGGKPYLSPDTLRFLHTALPEQTYALGWGIAERKWARGRALTHAGSNTMWYCVTWLAPERGFGVMVVTNAAGGDVPKACDEAASALIRHFEAGQAK